MFTMQLERDQLGHTLGLSQRAMWKWDQMVESSSSGNEEDSMDPFLASASE
jgi:hypothetical protein